MGIRTIVFFSMLLFITTATARAEESSFSLGLGAEFSSGSYGTDSRTSIVSLPLTIVWYPTERIDLSIDIPYLFQRNGTVRPGMVSAGPGNRTMLMPTGGMPGPGGSTGSGTAGTASSGAITQTDSGPGDITVRGGYILLMDDGLLPQIRPSITVKLPTASRSRGLGTGQYDGGVAVEISKWLGNFNVFVEPGYTVQEKDEQLALRNYWLTTVGLAWQITDSIRSIIFLKDETAPSDNSGRVQELRLKGKFQVTKQTGFEAYIAKGLTTNSPDYGSGFSIIHTY